MHGIIYEPIYNLGGLLRGNRAAITSGPPVAKSIQCRVCKHRERAQIDLALARHVSVTALAKRYSLGPQSLWRHSANHLTAPLRAKLLAGPDLDIDLDKLRETEGQSWLAGLVTIRNRLFAALDVAEEHGDCNMVARVVGRLHENLELVGRYLGDLGANSTTTINNILIAPAYIQMRLELVRALAPYPEAKVAVAEVLHSIEHKAAEEVGGNRRELAS